MSVSSALLLLMFALGCCGFAGLCALCAEWVNPEWASKIFRLGE